MEKIGFRHDNILCRIYQIWISHTERSLNTISGFYEYLKGESKEASVAEDCSPCGMRLTSIVFWCHSVTDYYQTSRGQHPNSKNWFLLKSVDQIAEYSSYEHVDMISPRPLLMIAGTKADTRFYSEMAIDKAKEPRELFLIDGATHIALYDKPEYVNPAVEKMSSFFEQYLQSANKLPKAEKKGYNNNKKAKNTKA